ncbi:probable serine hydrolase isoform X1 [Drosophila sulfurigaster albostrigata]|uniref:probable serine hydrolase isoform X1 n=1 Tax=Drosophila sulfurigaster albostrigata TaxID=89887 RepID=UPI002D21E036|nr:probable serine hydrolase isoform X1 [Drosophila sulfurigaster albostrigata]
MKGQQSLRLLRQLRNGTQQSFARRLAHGQSAAGSLRDHEDIIIQMPWGHIAGKWYGRKDVRPILGIHGWMDNAGTFDTLAPLLPAHLPLLTIDAPGHGLSSWLPKGTAYHSIELVQLMRRIIKYFNWEKLSLLGHSMSSLNGFVFGSMFPDKLDMFIGLDVMKPLIRSEKTFIDKLAERLENNLKLEERMLEGSEPPSYEWDKLVERMHLGTSKSISLESCQYILKRSCKPSKQDPNRFYFSHDNRVKASFVYTLSNETVLEMAARINVPYLFIKALQAPYYEDMKYYNATLDVLRKNPQFEYYEVEGSHHVHLNEPEKVAPLINAFINKYRPDV